MKRATTLRRALRVVALVCALVCALVAGRWTVAWAHAALVSAEPAAGSHLAASPTRVRLVFSEPLEAPLARLALVSTAGGTVRLTVAGDPTDVHAIVAPVDALPAGAYRLVWRIVSADGHPVDGSYTFSVGATTTAPPPAEEPLAAPDVWGPAVAGAPLVPALLRGLASGSLMALAGLLLFVAWPSTVGSTVRQVAPVPPRLAIGLALATPVLLAAHVAAWLVNASPDQRLTSDWAATALTSGVGQVEVWRTALSLLALWALGLARRPRVALLFAAAALAVSGATGHAAAIAPLWATPAKALHLLAGAAWLGGLLWLLTHVGDVGDVSTLAREMARVSTVALLAVVVVTLTGVVQTLLFLPSPLDVVRSTYGAVALAKVAGLLVLIAFGAHHRFRVLPRLTGDGASHGSLRGSLGTTLRREIVVMSVVVLLGGLLAYVPPPAMASAMPAGMPMSSTLTRVP